MPGMYTGGESFYAVIIICSILFFTFIACLGVRFLRRKKLQTEEQQLSSLNNDAWQQLRSVVTPLDSTDNQTLQTVSNWQSRYPPNTSSFIDVTKHPDVVNRGVLAWKFIEIETTVDAEEESNAAIMDEDPSNIVFCQGQGCIMTNLPVPIQEFSYWEVKVLQLDDKDRLAIGFATKSYPRWRLPGWHRHSVAYHSNTGSIFASDPNFGRAYGPAYKQGDVIGVGYLYQSGTVFFTRNGENLGKASIGFKYPIYPIIGSHGPCHVSTNFGLQDFLFSAANQREAAYGPKQGSLLPPPAYGGHTDDTMLFDNDQPLNSTGEQLTYVDRTVQPPPPSYS
ncbi:concanavalin A-like lectin/glucanase domain-containing protein [Thamnidium elegans]|nr:concanavalin A-like lectin/glucanase domain-containing protein [Thamnidium elegans]